jgi:hypothetical protein
MAVYRRATHVPIFPTTGIPRLAFNSLLEPLFSMTRIRTREGVAAQDPQPFCLNSGQVNTGAELAPSDGETRNRRALS